MFNLWGKIGVGIFLASFADTAHAITPEHLIFSSPAAGARDFYLYSPKNPQGLIVMLHGCKTNAEQFDQGTEMSAYALKNNFAVLYPEQNTLANYDHCWNWFWGTETELIADSVRMIQNRFHLKRDHTFLMGMSAGAAQGALLANCHRDLFSKVLLHSGLQFLAATNLDDAQTALENGAHTPSTQAAQYALGCNTSKAPVQFMVVFGSEDRRVNPINSRQNAQELSSLNQLLAMKSHRPGTLTTKDIDVPAEGFKLGYHQTNILIDGQLTGTLLQVHGLAHEWSGGNPAQPRNNPNGPKVTEMFFRYFNP